ITVTAESAKRYIDDTGLNVRVDRRGKRSAFVELQPNEFFAMSSDHDFALIACSALPADLQPISLSPNTSAVDLKSSASVAETKEVPEWILIAGYANVVKILRDAGLLTTHFDMLELNGKRVVDVGHTSAGAGAAAIKGRFFY